MSDSAIPWTVASVHGILQARILEWVVIPFSRGPSQPRDWGQVSHTAGRFFTIWGTKEAHWPRGRAKETSFVATDLHSWQLLCLMEWVPENGQVAVCLAMVWLPRQAPDYLLIQGCHMTTWLGGGRMFPWDMPFGICGAVSAARSSWTQLCQISTRLLSRLKWDVLNHSKKKKSLAENIKSKNKIIKNQYIIFTSK